MEEKEENMKYLAIVRHGLYFASSLDSFGQKQMLAAAKFLRQLFYKPNGYLTVAILSSPMQWVFESAEIISNELGIPTEKHWILKSINDSLGYKPYEIVAMISGDKYSGKEVIVLVCHQEGTRDIPWIFGEEILHVYNFPEKPVDYGELYLIDCEEKTCTLHSPYRSK